MSRVAHCGKANMGKQTVEKQSVLGTFFWCQVWADEGLELSPGINFCAVC